MKYIPLNDFYIIKKKKQQNQHQSIIVMPNDTKIDLAEVISVPASSESYGVVTPSPVNVGDCIAVRWSKVIGINEEVFGVALEDIVCKVEV